MKRLFWLGAGVAVGALVFRAVSKRAQSYTPRGLVGAAAESGRNLVDSVRDFVEDVRDGMHEREEQLHAAILAGVEADAAAGPGPGDRDAPGGYGGPGRHGAPGGYGGDTGEGTTR